MTFQRDGMTRKVKNSTLSGMVIRGTVSFMGMNMKTLDIQPKKLVVTFLVCKHPKNHLLHRLLITPHYLLMIHHNFHLSFPLPYSLQIHQNLFLYIGPSATPSSTPSTKPTGTPSVAPALTKRSNAS